MNSSGYFDLLTAWLATLVLQIPFILLSIFAAVFALARWRKHPRVSLYTIVSVCVSIVWTLVSSLLHMVMTANYFSSYTSDQRIQYYFIIGVISSLIHAATFGLLLLAIFSDRPANWEKPPVKFQ